MLSKERFDFVDELVKNGMFVRKIGRVWKGNISFRCHEDDVNYGKGERVLPASRYRIECSREIRIPEFNSGKFITKSFNMFCKDHVYKTRYGLFVHNTNVPKFFEKVHSVKSQLDELRDRIIDNRERIIDDMRTQYTQVAKDIWQRRYGDHGKPPANYVEQLVKRYVDRFPANESLGTRFTIEVFPVMPIVTDDMAMHAHIDSANHNMRVYRALYNEILYKRKGLYYVAGDLADVLADKADTGKGLAGAYKRTFLKMRGYITAMYYDPEVCVILNEICDTVAVNEESRERDKVVTLLKEVAHIVETDKMFVIHV